MLEKNVIEVAPLAFMRGRTLNDAFIIMDEAQNTTIEQMKMFLTRMGNNSKAVITGDITQIDLPNPRKSGLLDAINILDGVEGIHFCHFEDCDVSAMRWCSASSAPTSPPSRSSRNCRWRWAKPSKSATP
jgi:phosphate starvation-inducible protein PhoH and related proteins